MEITTTTLPPFQLEPNLNLTTSVSKKFNTPIIFEPNTPIKAIPDLNRLVFTDFKPSYGPIRTSWIGENVIHQIPAPIRTKKKKGKKKGKKKIRVKIQPTVKDNNINNGSGKSQSGNTETGTKNEGYLDKLVKMMGLLTGIWTGYLSEDSPNHINDYETGYSPNHIETGNSPDLIAAKQGQSGFSGGPVMGLVGTFGLGLAGWSLFNSGSLSFRSARGGIQISKIQKSLKIIVF
jgi:hypothetical protein